MRIKTSLVSGQRGLTEPARLQHQSLLQYVPRHSRLSHPLGSWGYGGTELVQWKGVALPFVNEKLLSQERLLSCGSLPEAGKSWEPGQVNVSPLQALPRTPNSASRLAGPMPGSACLSHRLYHSSQCKPGLQPPLKKPDPRLSYWFCSLTVKSSY